MTDQCAAGRITPSCGSCGRGLVKMRGKKRKDWEEKGGEEWGADHRSPGSGSSTRLPAMQTNRDNADSTTEDIYCTFPERIPALN